MQSRNTTSTASFALLLLACARVIGGPAQMTPSLSLSQAPLAPAATPVVPGATPELPTAPQASPNPFEPEIKALEAKLSDPPSNPIVFYGSSSIRLWKTLQQDFPGYQVLNCGFGGSRLTDCVKFAPRLVLRLKPSAVIIYAGDNDLALGAAPEKVFNSFQQLFRILRSDLPNVPIAFLSVKPSPARMKYFKNIRRFNEMVDIYLEHKPDTEYIDVCSNMLGPDEQPISSLFVGDQIHLSPAGYQILRKDVGDFLRQELANTKTKTAAH
jgi:lysophospholipase L1-like esterase